MIYKFPATINNLNLVMDHLMAFGIEITSVTKVSGKYHIETESPVPEDQIEHLELEVA